VQKNKRPGGQKTPTRGGWTIFFQCLILIFFLTNDWFFYFLRYFLYQLNDFFQWTYILMWIFFLLTFEILDANLSIRFFVQNQRKTFSDPDLRYGTVRSKIWSLNGKNLREMKFLKNLWKN
jgi:hypothetical protein